MRQEGSERQSGVYWHGLHVVFENSLNLIKLIALAGLFVAAADTATVAQSPEETAQIISPNVISVESASEAGLPIRVITSEESSFVLIEGLPQTVALSEGRLFESGVWAVKVTKLQGLKIVAIAESEEEWDLVLSLKTLDGKVLAEARPSLRVSPVRTETTQASKLQPETSTPTEFDDVTTTRVDPQPVDTRPALKAPGQTAIPSPIISNEETERITRMMQKGIERLNNGNISGARLLFSRAAEYGWADGAFHMARTYDDAELRAIGTIGVKPEPELAVKWYKHAIELGSTIALVHLKRLQPEPAGKANGEPGF
jgi:hypothetical protein